jgi:hypothetical protein
MPLDPEFDTTPWISPFSPNGTEELLPWGNALSWEEFAALFPFPLPILVCFFECAIIFLCGPFFYMLNFGSGKGQGMGGVNAAHLTAHNANAAATQAQAHMAQAQALGGGR